MAELATAWGWTPAQVDAIVWHQVPGYLQLARTAAARRTRESLLLSRAVANWDKRMSEWFKELTVRAYGPEDPRLEEARSLESMARLSGQADAKLMLQRAKYLRTVVKYNIQEGKND